MYWWENRFLKAENGKLCLGGRTAESIAESYGTPLFVYDREQVRTNCDNLRRLFNKAIPQKLRICYAMKANFHPEILKTLLSQGCWIDAVSPGEVDAALKAGFPEDRILFTGTSVSVSDLEKVFKRNNIIVTIDAIEQLELMREVKNRVCRSREIKVMIRMNPGIGTGFSPKAITAGAKTSDGTPVKFGVEEKKVIPAVEKASLYGFNPVGLHQHLGSGWTSENFEDVKSAVDIMFRKALDVQQRGFPLELIDLGGGFGPRYSEDQDLFPLDKYAEHIAQRFSSERLDIKSLAVEPGKYLVGDAGVLLLRVEYVKESYGNLFACVNGGTFNTIPRPAIYTQAHHHIINCSQVASEKMVRMTVPGNLCETGDVFRKEVWMPLPKRGDILALLSAGAYCRSMASHFNLREIPQEIIIG
ncbi:MAG: diaminopimelate decarboxylase [Candidatus Aminicenantes bacterium]|nr:diaminopimelate decarboxylase [Candidatus Aminicenantes bacterium]